MDVLSEILRVVRIEGGLFFNAEFSAPWCVRTPRSSDLALDPAPGAGHIIVYHLLTEGRAYAKLESGQRVELAAGDIVIFPHGDSHRLGNGLPEAPVDSDQAFAGQFTQGLRLARFGGGGEITRFVCGYLACEPRLSQAFLAGLPPMLRVPVGSQPSGQWLQQSIQFSVDQAGGASPGAAIVSAKLSELLFVETLRRYIESLPPGETGWLAGARDPGIGRVLTLIHNKPGDPWTVSQLARRAGLSRTQFAGRFRHFLGQSPMAYLAHWRLELGAERLRSTTDSVAAIAASIGYGSEAAFNRAFKRAFQCPPAQFRRKSAPPGSATGSSSSPPRP